MSQFSPEPRPAEGIILHKDGIIVDVDEETASMFGYRRDEMINRPVRDLFPDYEEPAPVLKPIARNNPSETKQSSAAADKKKTMALRKNGTSFDVDMK